MHDLSLLVLPLVLITDYYVRVLTQEPRRRLLWLPVLPVLISPLWIVLWLVGSAVNLMAIPFALVGVGNRQGGVARSKLQSQS